MYSSFSNGRWVGLMTVLAIALTSCGLTQATYFRSYSATQEDERAAWGLCGGDFLPNGQLDPKIEPRVVSCMRNRGFLMINEYYVEDHIDFVLRSDPAERFYIYTDLKECGAQAVDSGICSETHFGLHVDRRDVPALSRCMSRKGYTPALPRYKQGLRIIENGREINGNFCLSLTPRNQKGGVSLGKYRFE